jgi:oxygen-independent coproporphyrinogen-3 oxidase
VGGGDHEGPGLYLHVPFCESLCSYCDFYSEPIGEATGNRFTRALRTEAERRAPAGFAASTVYVGGGTPSALDEGELSAVLGVAGSLSVERGPVAEWTVECNPGSLTASKAALMRRAGVTRLSIGVQSFDDDVLRSLGRVHDAREAREAVGIAQASGIGDVSVDLLFAVPGQGLPSFRSDLDEALRLGVHHVSAYALLYEEGTELTRQLDTGKVRAEDPDRELEMIRLVVRVLGEAGLRRYEISSYARPGHACLHNLNYWRNGAYLGLGPAAASYLEGVRSVNVRSWREYEEAVLSGREATETRERLAPRPAMGEELMLRLRTSAGASLGEVSRRWSIDAGARYGALVRRLSEAGYLRIAADGDRISLTRRGFEVADAVLGELLAVP